MKNTLIINTHQKYEGISSGSLNKFYVESMSAELRTAGFQVKTTNVENGYKIGDEIEKHEWADFIIVQSPVYWFGAPYIHKKYIDEVFTQALKNEKFVASDGRSRDDPNKQYGTGGLMRGKQFMLSLTWNAPENAFNDKKQFLMEGRSADDLFFHITAAYKFCGANILPTFSSYDVMKNPSIGKDAQQLKQHIKDHIISKDELVA
ncbi:NAD(P)H-dependent oxidoreductase [Puniceicoccaceae bacterium K14]|nr:NAD(P)H-dependent oxidoreductase [Puniceicoccaceae bacterium K14]